MLKDYKCLYFKPFPDTTNDNIFLECPFLDHFWSFLSYMTPSNMQNIRKK